MTKSAIRASFLWTALFFCTACERSPAHVDEKAQEAWELYRRRPDELSFRNFIGVNRKAANEHDRPHDATGVEYQLRACEVMTMEAERPHVAGFVRRGDGRRGARGTRGAGGVAQRLTADARDFTSMKRFFAPGSASS